MRNPDRLLPRLSRGVMAIAAAAVASAAAAQAAPADAASAAVAAAAAALRPINGSQKATVEELLRADAEAALRAARGAAAVPAPAPAPAAPAEAVTRVEPPKPEPVIAVDAIYGTRTAERDDRMVDLSVDGKVATLRRGDALSSFRLVDIDGACALVVKEAATAKTRTKTRTKPAAKPPKSRRVCIEDTRLAAPSFDNSLTVGGPAAAMPSPIFRQLVAPGQPIAPTSR